MSARNPTVSRDTGAGKCRNPPCFYVVFSCSVPCIFLSDSSFAHICHPSPFGSRSQLGFHLLLSLSAVCLSLASLSRLTLRELQAMGREAVVGDREDGQSRRPHALV